MDGTTGQLSMTAAELSFLLASGGQPGEAPRLLGLTDADRADAVLGAGLGSLLLRHLAAPVEGQKLELAPAVAAVAAGLHHPRAFVQVGLTARDHADGSLLFEAEMTRFLVAVRAYHCYDITPIGTDVDVREPLLAIADRFLHRHRPAVATFNTFVRAGRHPREGPVPSDPRVGDGWLLALRRQRQHRRDGHGRGDLRRGRRAHARRTRQDAAGLPDLVARTSPSRTSHAAARRWIEALPVEHGSLTPDAVLLDGQDPVETDPARPLVAVPRSGTEGEPVALPVALALAGQHQPHE